MVNWMEKQSAIGRLKDESKVVVHKFIHTTTFQNKPTFVLKEREELSKLLSKSMCTNIL